MSILKNPIISLLVTYASVTTLFAVETQYQIVDLGLNDYETSVVTSINNQGWVSGTLWKGGYSAVFVVDENKKLAKSWINCDGGSFINNNNEVYGSLITRVERFNWTFDEERVYKWINPFNYFQYFNFYDLYCPKGAYSFAYDFKSNIVWDVNDLGQVLVMNTPTKSLATDELSHNLVWLYDNGEYVKIQNPQFTAGFKVNNHSQILGSYSTGSKLHKDRQRHLSIYNFHDKTVRTFDFPGDALGADINDNGQIIGYFYDPTDDLYKGFLIEASGEMVELNNFSPIAINNKGVILGHYIYAEKKDQCAIWENGVFQDLNEIVTLVDDNNNSWDSIDDISDINDDGDLIGCGTINNKTRGLVLKKL